NLNRLGKRNPSVYGQKTLAEIEADLAAKAKTLGLEIEFRQSNQEGDLVNWCQEAGDKASALIINAGGYTHTSVAIRDALEVLNIPVFEVHLSNIYAREDFRRTSLLSAHATGVIAGLGDAGYHFALEEIAKKLT
ncbi:MAG TPA: type II 3-dehydroquinate dehydratase, partial [Sphingomonadales bacterium]|nr:type II 3-dehydroquinate dehydratase [Sphingomonadales bacterium]